MFHCHQLFPFSRKVSGWFGDKMMITKTGFLQKGDHGRIEMIGPTDENEPAAGS